MKAPVPSSRPGLSHGLAAAVALPLNPEEDAAVKYTIYVDDNFHYMDESDRCKELCGQ